MYDVPILQGRWLVLIRDFYSLDSTNQLFL